MEVLKLLFHPFIFEVISFMSQILEKPLTKKGGFFHGESQNCHPEGPPHPETSGSMVVKMHFKVDFLRCFLP